VRWCTTVQAVETALPQGSSLRSGLCCPGPSPLNRPHPSHSQAQRDFAAERLIRAALAVRQTCTPRRPTSGSVLSLAYCLDMSSSGTPGSSSVTSIQSVHRRHWPSTSLEGLGASHAPHPPLSWGSLISGLHYGSLSLRVRVGIMIARDPLHRSGQAAFPHPALASGMDDQPLRGIRMNNAGWGQPAGN
jgi:hypothetical protein